MTTAHEEDEKKKSKKTSCKLEGNEEVTGRNVTSLRMTKKSSEQEHRVDAKAPSAEEGRGKLRKVRGSRKQA